MSILSKTEIGKRIALLRVHHQLSQTEFGKSIGVSRTSISNIERGDSFPSLELLTQIITQYKTSYESIILGTSIYHDDSTNNQLSNSNNLQSPNTYKIDQSEVKISHLQELLIEKENTIEILKSALSDKERLISFYEKASTSN